MKHSKLRVFLIALFATVAAIIIVCVAAFSMFRWVIVDDARDVQGTWTIENSSAKITISDTEIRMSEDVIFTYTLDSGAKQITEHLAYKTGKVHYVFSADRKELLLIEQDMDFFTATFLDAGNLLQTFFSGTYSDSSAGFVNSDIAEDSIVRLHRG